MNVVKTASTTDTRIRGVKVMKFLQRSMLLLIPFFVVAAMNDWQTVGIIAFIAFLIACLAYPISIAVVARSSKKVISVLREEMENTMAEYAEAHLEDRKANPPTILDPGVDRFYQEITTQLDSRLDESGTRAFFSDPYCIVRQSVIMNIAEAVYGNPETTLLDLHEKIQSDELYSRTEADADPKVREEYARVMLWLEEESGLK